MVLWLPVWILVEGHERFVRLLKKHDIHWDFWYSLLAILCGVLIVMLFGSYN